jgi:CheY-like chemotaxis protein
VTLLRRTLGEAITVTLTQDPDLWPVLADPGQLENAILNLAINARDAMPQGGTLHLETGRVTLTAAELADVEIARSNSAQPGEAGFGDYVMIAVIDTGTGMKPEILARVFDPFFTTKTDGKGTGLGLSMVYGFTSQSGGHLRIESSPGKGTAVRMYLPRVMGTAAPQPAAAPQNRLASLPHGHETILVVDDNAGIRETASLILQSLGYVVLEAGDGGEALALMDHAPHLDLLFTDVVMPGGINGPALARAATERWPDLAVLLTSGYVNPGIAIGDTADSPWDLLVKPYRREELALRVRAVLDEAAG